MQNKIKEIEKACQRANPECSKSKIRACEEYPDDMHRYGAITFEPYTLSDVLLAMPSKVYINSNGKFGHFHKHDHFRPQVAWNFLDDSLDSQSKETIEFIHNLLKE